MSTYRTGGHHGVTIVREGDGSRCGRPEHDCDRGHLIAVVVDGGQELAERICALLNDSEERSSVWPKERVGAGAFQRERLGTWPAADSCTCVYRPNGGADPNCPVHQGRKARGPRPPYLGPGCICDGSGRTCPRHGVVL
jgi:hypothetical protein